jgi:hypothetical protein
VYHRVDLGAVETKFLPFQGMKPHFISCATWPSHYVDCATQAVTEYIIFIRIVEWISDVLVLIPIELVWVS